MSPAVSLIFPGQNSRYPSMFRRLVEWDPANAAWLRRASDVLGRDLARQYDERNPDAFARNRDVQIAVFLANHMHWQNLERAGVDAGHSAGLSLGEYNHLVHIGALSFDDALVLLEARGAAYENGPAGGMIAVYPVAVADIRDLVDRLGLGDRVDVALINSPRHVVLSGDSASVTAAAAAAQEEFLAEATTIDGTRPMHSRLFAPVAAAFRPALDAAPFQSPRRPYLPNVTGSLATNPPAAFFADALVRQVRSTVRWSDSMETLLGVDEQMVFIECGPRSVLTNLFGRKWRSPMRYATDAADDFASGLERVLEELTGGVRRAAGAV